MDEFRAAESHDGRVLNALSIDLDRLAFLDQK